MGVRTGRARGLSINLRYDLHSAQHHLLEKPNERATGILQNAQRQGESPACAAQPGHRSGAESLQGGLFLSAQIPQKQRDTISRPDRAVGVDTFGPGVERERTRGISVCNSRYQRCAEKGETPLRIKQSWSTDKPMKQSEQDPTHSRNAPPSVEDLPQPPNGWENLTPQEHGEWLAKVIAATLNYNVLNDVSTHY